MDIKGYPLKGDIGVINGIYRGYIRFRVWGLPNIRGSFSRVPIRRITTFWVYFGVLDFRGKWGKYHRRRIFSLLSFMMLLLLS